MTTVASAIAEVLERGARDTVEALRGVSEAQLNQPLDLPETNTLYALATHLVGAGEFWSVTLLAKHPVVRDRPAEFRATGALPDLVARYERWIADLHAVLDGMPDAALVGPVVVPEPYSTGGETTTAIGCLLHAIEHSALHLGHIQLTAQLLRQG